MIRTEISSFYNLNEKEKEDWMGQEHSNRLRVYDDELIAEEYDYGEPEDNSFRRDYEWVAPLLKKVYDIGKEDGYENGYNIGNAHGYSE
jgi:hypothetical protein